MTPREVLTFWLDEVGQAGWYNATKVLDDTCRSGFTDAWMQAKTLAQDWAGDAEGALAALILTDQLSRNMFRDDAQSFATDRLARHIADGAIAAGYDMATAIPARQFFYMPFMHSEEMEDQDRAVLLFGERMPGDNLRHARLHRDVIRYFGRFPWRNTVLGREMTPQERIFIEQGAYGALVTGRVSLADAE
ncbi:MAG: DUF924 family protein [Paracoccus sp. (in: a-proteobacteria)]